MTWSFSRRGPEEHSPGATREFNEMISQIRGAMVVVAESVSLPLATHTHVEKMLPVELRQPHPRIASEPVEDKPVRLEIDRGRPGPSPCFRLTTRTKRH